MGYLEKFNKKKRAATPPRTLQDVEKEFTQTMIQAGQLQYQAKVMGWELDQLNLKAKDLNNEAHGLKAKMAQVANQSTGDKKDERTENSATTPIV